MSRTRALAPAALALAACAPAPVTRCWIADAGASAIVALDAELYLRGSTPLAGVRLVSYGSALWATAAERDAERLVRLDESASVVEACFATPGRIVALVADDAGAFFLEDAPPAATRLWRVGGRADRTLLGAFPGAVALAIRRDEVLIGTGAGELVLLRRDGAVRAESRAPGRVRALFPGPGGGRWWVLAGDDPARVELRDAALRPHSGFLVDPALRALAPDPRGERAWLVFEHEVRRHGAGGRLERALVLPEGPWCGATATGRGVLLYAPGAVLEVEERGGTLRAVRAQGGFSALRALAVR